MNLLGCVSKVMENTGLKVILEEIYGCNAVYHILQGKAYSRALRGNLIVAQAMSCLVYEKHFPDDEIFISTLYGDLVKNETTPDEIESNEKLTAMRDRYGNYFESMTQKSRTYKLWFNYIKIVSIIQNLIRADRLGLFTLHLDSIKEALPVFAAAGHYNYVKSAYLYVQNMEKLQQTNPEVYNLFQAVSLICF